MGWWSTTKLPVERLSADNIVRAVRNGPQGRVTDVDRCGWTLVAWEPRLTVMPYKHGSDCLYLLEAETGPADEPVLAAVARCLAQLDGKFIGAAQWRAEAQAEYEGRARRVLQTIENVKAGNRTGGLP